MALSLRQLWKRNARSCLRTSVQLGLSGIDNHQSLSVVTPHVVLPSDLSFFSQSSAQGGTLVIPKSGASMKPRRKKRPAPTPIRYYTENQKKIVTQKALAAGMSFNRYVVTVSVGSSYKPPLNPELRMVLLGLKRELTAHGNNLNQITKHVNSTSLALPSVLTAIRPLTEDIYKTIEAIRAALCQGEPAL